MTAKNFQIAVVQAMLALQVSQRLIAKNKFCWTTYFIPHTHFHTKIIPICIWLLKGNLFDLMEIHIKYFLELYSNLLSIIKVKTLQDDVCKV